MLEQTKKNGRVYDVQPGQKSVLSKAVKIPEIVFGPYRPITVYRITDNEMWVKDENKGDWYHYEGDGDKLSLTSREKTHNEPAPGCFYAYGMAEQNGKLTPYYVQDMPYVQKHIVPDIETMEMPFSMRSLDYGRLFTYPNALKQLLGTCPVAYADKFKRPIIRSQGHTYPINLQKQSFRWNELSDSCYPVVADLSGTQFAVLDLEPTRTRDEELTYESIMGYYEEETIRGGRHKLVKLSDPTFKFRYGNGLELIANGMITFYGINGVMLSLDPPPMKTEGFAPVGHVQRSLKLTDMGAPKNIGYLVEKLESYTGDLKLEKTKIHDKHRLNLDNSNREFNILLELYNLALAPNRHYFSDEDLPWILAEYANDIIEPREKHATQRNGLPYLVYLSAIICQNKEGAKIWKP